MRTHYVLLICVGETSINVTTTEGYDVELRCPENLKNLRSVAWWKNRDRIVVNDKVQRDFKGHMSFHDTTGTLTIREAQLNDSGIYYCNVGFDDPGEIHLTVHGKFQHQTINVYR